MKITHIRLEGFRAFDQPFELDLADGKNLLLHGENGSGKSSLFFALKRFFEERGGDVGLSRNLFSPDERGSSVALHIFGTDDDGTPHDRDFVWNGPEHPLAPPTGPPPHPLNPTERSKLVSAARRSGFLEYRDLLRLSLYVQPMSRYSSWSDVYKRPYGHGTLDLGEQFFDLTTWVILNGVRVATGYMPKTIGQLIRDVWEHNPRRRYASHVAFGLSAIRAFNDAFAAVLPQLELKVTDLLTQYENHHVQVTFDWQPLQWNRELKRIENARLMPRIVFRGVDLANQSHEVLNEARLSAIGLCIFFAGVLLSDTDTANPAHPRFLVLDDALIGLDLQNRIPVLRILQSPAFRHYQIFLLTHDRVWFDLARGHLPTTDGWIHQELIADESTGQLIPRFRPSQGDLDRACYHLTNGDLRAAGVYARAAFECRLQNVCETNGIEIKYRKDPKEVTVDKLWQGIRARQEQREKHRQDGHPTAPDFIPPALVRDVETMRSTVLNQLSHANSPGLVKADVEAAITTIAALYAHDFPKAS